MTNSLIRGLVIGGLMCSLSGVVFAATADDVSGVGGDTAATATSSDGSKEDAAANTKANAKAKAKAKAQSNGSSTSTNGSHEHVVDVPDPEDLGSD